MSKYVFVKNGEEFDYATTSLPFTETITVTVRKPLWRPTGRLTIEELAALGVQVKFIPTQTKARQDYEHITALYTLVPEFSVRVTEWKAMYDELGIPPSASVAEIEAAEIAKYGEDEIARGQFHDRFMGKRTEVMVNYQAAERLYCAQHGQEYDGCDDYTMWTDFPTLVKWVPGTFDPSEIPVERQIEIIPSSEREEEIRREDEEIDPGN